MKISDQLRRADTPHTFMTGKKVAFEVKVDNATKELDGTYLLDAKAAHERT
jgi:hypothetical protein